MAALRQVASATNMTGRSGSYDGDGAERAGLDVRTRTLLEAPLVPLLLRLATPNVVLMLAQAATGLIETYFIGHLGTAALAGVAVVFPGVMLTQMISGGAMGGGISSAIARALGGGRGSDASALVLHAIVINGTLGVLCSIGVVAFGPTLYRSLGAEGAALQAALAYSDVIFCGSVLLWVMNALASVVRGTGNMLVPAAVICGGALLLVPTSPALIFGIGPLPALGVAGGAWALIGYYFGGTAVLGWYLWSGRSPLRPRLFGVTLRRTLFHQILRVGGIASLSSLQTNLTIMFTTGMVGQFGSAALAGFGTGSRLEYLLVPLAFGIGGPLVAVVGTNVGAGQADRALRAAWIGAAMGFGVTEAIGLLAATFPQAWLSLFDTDPAMLATGSQYLRIVGPFYGFFGLGLVLYFASQGAGRMFWPVAGQFIRLAVAVFGAALALHAGGGLRSVFAAIALALVAYGITVAASIVGGAWTDRAVGTTVRAPVRPVA